MTQPEAEITEATFDVEPRVVMTTAGWLAVTPHGHPYRVGARGLTAGAAVVAFRHAMERWRALHYDRPMPSGVPAEGPQP